MLSLLEKLINEHGSSAILRERLILIKAEYEALERKCSDLQSKNGALQLEVEQLRSRSGSLESELDMLKSGAFATYVCDHCGSPDLVRIGSRPDPTFGDLGVKQKVFKCNKCGQESAFTPEGT
jgi:predicted RNA-binding Zn-ribbon protein involved in translation (DUF1610 family)